MGKQINDFIKVTIAHICNQYFKTGILPGDFQYVMKSGDEMLFSNYKPVSVLPVLSKIIERLMYNRLAMYVNENKLFKYYSFVFKRKYLLTWHL